MVRSFLIALFVILFSTPAFAQPISVGACDGYAPGVTSGAQAKVGPGGANRIRQAPGLSETQIGEMPAGSIMLVLYGPVCADEYTWWLVRFQDTTGWTAEGQNTVHWLLPTTSQNHAPDQPPGTLGGIASSVFYANYLCISGFDATMPTLFEEGRESDQSGDAIAFMLGTHSLRDEPGVCVPESISASEITVLSPEGYLFPADIDSLFEGVIHVSLPEAAYAIPGRWMIQVQDYSLFVDVELPPEPVVQGLYNEDGTYKLVLAGFLPNERIVIVSSATTGPAVSYRPDEAEVVTPVDDLSIFDPTSATIGALTLRSSVFTELRDASLTMTRPVDSITTLVDPTLVGALDGTLTALDTESTVEISKLVFDQLEIADISVIADLGMNTESGTAGGVFGMTFDDFDGIEVQADGSGVVLGTFRLQGKPLAAIGEFGSLAVWSNLQTLYTTDAPDDREALRLRLFNAYWASAPTPEPNLPCVYVVQRGDTLARIARAYGIELSALLAANPQIENPDVIRRGWEITIPECE